MAGIVLEVGADADLGLVHNALRGCGVWGRTLGGALGSHSGARVVVLEGHSKEVNLGVLLDIPGVLNVYRGSSPHPKVDELRNRNIWVGSALIGGDETPLLMAGPCSVESEEQIHQCAAMVKRCGGRVLRGGAFKPRTSPYAFSGAGKEALGWLRDAALAHDLGVVTEVMSEREVDSVARAADLIQVGSRNMQNFALLGAVGAQKKPVLLKRGMAASVEEWLLAGEHLLAAGCSSVIFCERGIRSFDDTTRNLLDLSAVALLRHVHGLRVVVDPSHGTGRRDLIAPMSKAALAAGADGLLLEVHVNPAEAVSDGPQALRESELENLSQDLGLLLPT